jgi:hypothetical protein
MSSKAFSVRRSARDLDSEHPGVILNSDSLESTMVPDPLTVLSVISTIMWLCLLAATLN